MNIYHIALSMIPGLGAKSIRQLVDIFPDVEALFSMNDKQLREIFGRHEGVIQAFLSKESLSKAEKEAQMMERYHIKPLFFTDPEYPTRLNNAGCEDTPVLLYCLGSCNLNAEHTVAFVGSRKCTDYGRTTTARLIQEFKGGNIVTISGLAYGIDTAAHAASLDNQTPTIAVLGHGLDQIYPSQNRALSKRILEMGGALLTEYPLYTAINPTYFPARNRIIAALADATVVVEAAEKGGALITANMANGYHREVFAVPGRLDDPMSAGCNNLIASNKAGIVRNAGDIYYQMGWKNFFDKKRQREEQQQLFADLTENEQLLVNLLKENRELTLDDFCERSPLSMPKIASILTDLELKKVVRCLPGRIYKLC